MRVNLINNLQKEPISYLANIARNSRGKFKLNQDDYDDCKDLESVFNLYKWRHHSIFEFIDFAWYIEDISRACANQLVRHRIASYVQNSDRYINHFDNEKIWDNIILPSLQNQLKEDFVKQIKDLYKKAIAEGIQPEDARMLLPMGFPTSIIVKMNMREFLFNFYSLRSSKHAQWEIRDLADQMLREVRFHSDIVMNSFLDKYFEERGQNEKVL